MIRQSYPRPNIPNGFYRHYIKGRLVEVFGLSRRESDGIWEVLHRNPYSQEYWHRPATEWFEIVAGNCPRFVWVSATLS